MLGIREIRYNFIHIYLLSLCRQIKYQTWQSAQLWGKSQISGLSGVRKGWRPNVSRVVEVNLCLHILFLSPLPFTHATCHVNCLLIWKKKDLAFSVIYYFLKNVLILLRVCLSKLNTQNNLNYFCIINKLLRFW